MSAPNLTTEARPKGLTPDEVWAWENSEPGSWVRRALAWAAPRREETRRREAEVERRRAEAGWERGELRASLPGTLGLECIFYQFLAHKTCHLRGRLYVIVEAEGVRFRPGPAEHFPVEELARHQTRAGEAVGAGRELEVAFICYSPEGSGAAEEAVSLMVDGLQELREICGLPDGERSKFGTRHGTAHVVKVFRNPEEPYRPIVELEELGPTRARTKGETT